MRDGKTDSWGIISHRDNMNGTSYTEEIMSSVIFEFADEFWHLYVDRNKLMDVMNMPSYIVEDWLWANRQAIDEGIVKYHISCAEGDVKHQAKKHQSLKNSLKPNIFNEENSEKAIVAAEEKLAILLAIQRRIKIDKIIS